MSNGHMENIGFIRKNANSLPKVAFISSPERNWNMLWTVPAQWPIVRQNERQTSTKFKILVHLSLVDCHTFTNWMSPKQCFQDAVYILFLINFCTVSSRVVMS